MGDEQGACRQRNEPPFYQGGKAPMHGRPLLNGPSLLPFVRGGKVG